MLTKEEFRDLYLQKTKELGFEEYNKDELIDKLKDIQDDILNKNEVMNITAIKDEKAFLVLHWMDALSILKFIKDDAKVLDIGTGGGMVAICTALFKPDAKVVALDSSGKRMTFLNELKQKYKIDNLKVVCARAEDYIRKEKNERESYDVVLARAVANLNPLSELCIPYVKIGGVFVAMKGSNAKEELKQAMLAIETLGGAYEEDVLFEPVCEGEKIEHHNILIRKKTKTNPLYPRNYNQILKNPL